jgi:hypothetical protein
MDHQRCFDVDGRDGMAAKFETLNRCATVIDWGGSLDGDRSWPVLRGRGIRGEFSACDKGGNSR